MEIANLVISILSLIATIAISFVIYFLEQHNQKVSKEKEVKQEAKRFIIDNADELDYLHWLLLLWDVIHKINISEKYIIILQF